jgi:uncharacterized protein with HEPN domain
MPQIKMGKSARFRDLISHHYTHIHHEIVYAIFKAYLPKPLNREPETVKRFSNIVNP